MMKLKKEPSVITYIPKPTLDDETNSIIGRIWLSCYWIWLIACACMMLFMLFTILFGTGANIFQTIMWLIGSMVGMFAGHVAYRFGIWIGTGFWHW